MKIAIVGAGGIGGYFGGRWAEAGVDVTLIARGSQYEAIRANGITIRSALGDATTPVRVVKEAAETGVADLVILATKAWQLDDALSSAAPLIGDNTLVLGLQNGVEAAEIIGRAIGADRTIAGTVRIISFIDSPGVIKHAGGAPTLIFGETNGGVTPRAERLRDLMAHGRGMAIELTADSRLEVWRKFHWFAPLAAVGSVTRSPAGMYRSVPASRQLLIDAMNEVLALANQIGVALGSGETEKAMQFVDSLPADATSTMMRDFRDGKRTELEFLSGAITRLGVRYSVPTPANAFMYAALLPMELAARAR